jgi:hypothetical protein
LVDLNQLYGKAYKYIWLLPIIGSILILIESILHLSATLDVGIGIIISILVIILTILTRKDVHGSGIALGICAYFLILSPLGFSGFMLGSLLILVGALVSISGGFFTYTNFFIWVALGAIVLDLILFFVFYI